MDYRSTRAEARSQVGTYCNSLAKRWWFGPEDSAVYPEALTASADGVDKRYVEKAMKDDSRIFMVFPCGTGAKESACQFRRCQEMQVRSLSQEDPLEEGIAVHSSILACRSSWTEKPGGLRPIESQRVRHD